MRGQTQPPQHPHPRLHAQITAAAVDGLRHALRREREFIDGGSRLAWARRSYGARDMRRSGSVVGVQICVEFDSVALPRHGLDRT